MKQKRQDDLTRPWASGLANAFVLFLHKCPATEVTVGSSEQDAKDKFEEDPGKFKSVFQK